MSELFIDASGTITRVALTQDGELVEFMIDTPEDSRLVGNIYRGRVESVLQGMQAAFVDIGREKNAFLFVSDMPIDRRDIDTVVTLEDKLSVTEGQEIMVQVLKDEVGSKGARVSTNLSIVGRYVVATPTLSFYGISRKIEDLDKRNALSKMLREVLPQGWGGIARTSSATASKRDIANEVGVHKHVYANILTENEHAQVGDILHNDGDLVARVARDVVDEYVTSIITNNESLSERFKKYLNLIGMKNVDVKTYPSTFDLFGDFDLTRKIKRLLSTRVTLPGGGTLIIDKTEALTVVDVNSGRYIGSTYLEDTVYAVNLEAAKEIARQLRLRNIGGIIIVDFIDMELEEHRLDVLRELEEALKFDRVKTRVAGMTSLGLVQITRKKMRNDISCYLQESCPHCEGSGKVVAASVVVPKVAKYVNIAFCDPTVTTVLVRVHQAVFDAISRGALSKECETLWQNQRVYAVEDATCTREDVKVETFEGAVVRLPDAARLLY